MAEPESLFYQLMGLNASANPMVGAPPASAYPSYASSTSGTGYKPMPNLPFDQWESDILGAGKNPNGSGFGMNIPTMALGLKGISELGGLYLGLQQLGLAKDSFKFQKQAYATNLANQTASYNTQMRDRIAGRNYATEEERRAAEAAALLPAR